MKKNYLRSMIAFLSSFSFVFYLQAAPSVVDNHIKVDQFGYRCNDQKIAVISNPQTGYNAASVFNPGTGTNQYQLRDWNTDAVEFSGTLTSWNSGNTHTQSGDRVWWFDFSSVTTPGDYYVFDVVNNVGSYRFEIGDQVYKTVLEAAVRSFYYQRCGVAKTSAHAGAAWADASCHVGALQDNQCRLYNAAGNPATEKNLSGGWHDAGDYNKYVNFTWGTLTDLLLAYEENIPAWTDDYSIPESGNGIPDLLDEIKFELDWLLKMQQADGSVLCIVGGGAASPPSADAAQRRYGPATTSATLTCASVFAQASRVYASLGIPAMTTYATTLSTAAVNAWNWANTNTNVQFRNNDGNAPWFSAGLGAGQQEVDDYGRMARKLAAACFLYALTGNTTYRTFFDNNYTQMQLIAWSYAYPFQTTEQDMLLYYAKIPGATPAVISAIQTRYSNSMRVNNADNLVNFMNYTDAYRAYLASNNYTWGSNSVKSGQGNMFMNMLNYSLDGPNAVNYQNAASGYLHYLHGINPNALVFLSNMENYAAENSLREFYHAWFYEGSALWDRVGTSTYGPAPGFLTGGPNPGWTLDGCCSSTCGSAAANALCVTLAPPSGQPVQKSYRDWNTGWPQNSWSVTENAIYYQAAYIRLLSKFIGIGTCGVELSMKEQTESLATRSSVAGSEVLIYPNPFTQDFIIELSSASETLHTVVLYNAQGIPVSSPFTMYGGERKHAGRNMGKGIYFVKILDGNSVRSYKIIKEE